MFFIQTSWARLCPHEEPAAGGVVPLFGAHVELAPLVVASPARPHHAVLFAQAAHAAAAAADVEVGAAQKFAMRGASGALPWPRPISNRNRGADRYLQTRCMA